jgi:hypothetical protein
MFEEYLRLRLTFERFLGQPLLFSKDVRSYTLFDFYALGISPTGIDFGFD